MKMKILAIAFLCYAATTFAQNSDDYVEIVLDGKKAWMHKTSGYVKYEKQGKANSHKTEKNSPSKIISNTSTYKVIEGDTYYNISNAHNISVTQILAWNNLSKDQPLQIGTILKVKPQNTKKTGATPQKNTSTKYHVVTKGETLYSISRKYGISVQSLQVSNNLQNNTIAIGQQLTIK